MSLISNSQVPVFNFQKIEPNEVNQLPCNSEISFLSSEKHLITGLSAKSAKKTRPVLGSVANAWKPFLGHLMV
jgi:hypothetical protein